jgi:acyl-CoA thioesterase FadM
MRAQIDVQVRFTDFDAGGNVDNTTLVGYLNEPRNTLLQALPVDWMRFAVRRVDVEFVGAVGLDVRSVRAEAELVSVGETSLRTRETLRAGDRLLVTASAVLVYVDETRTRAVRLPDEVRALAPPAPA